MIKITRVKSKINRYKNTTRVTDSIAMRIDGIVITSEERRFLERKYRNISVSTLDSGTVISFSCSGYSVCSPEDDFDERIGLSVAGHKSWNKTISKAQRIMRDIISMELRKIGMVVNKLMQIEQKSEENEN